MPSSLKPELPFLKNASTALFINGNSWCWRGSFLNCSASLGFDLSSTLEWRLLIPIRDPVSNIIQDVWNLCTLASRMDWFRDIAIQDNWCDRHPFQWSLYTGLDIQQFHVELRSILDYAATILVKLADKPEQVRGNDSFEKLSQWSEAEPSAENKLGNQVSAVIRSGCWYKNIRQIRDNIVHYGANAFVFGEPTKGILFQVSKHFINQINIRELMWNENVVDFELYAGLYFARLLELLEKLGNLISGRIPPNYVTSGVEANYDGLDVYANWINRLIEKIQADVL